MSLPPLPNLIPASPDPRPRIVREIAAFLADWPLYRTFKYQGDMWSRTNAYYTFTFPRSVRLYCSEEECQTTQVWEVQNGSFTSNSSAFDQFISVSFTCRNCQRSRVHYFLHVKVNQKGGQIAKVGQWPPLSREADPIVVAGWGNADKLLYRDAMTFRNANKGIGALPYLRRIIENHIHDVLDLILAANQRKPLAGFDQTAFERIRTSHRFSEKLDFARDYLPSDLTPVGYPNPIGALYELISDGLHERTEEECVEIFDRCKVAFEYVVRKLTEAKQQDEAYIEAIQKLKGR
jgi:predicted DNA-binding protein